LEPVGLWAIRTVILQAKEQIKWEEVKEWTLTLKTF
jgi:hypothetical protein